MTTIDDIARKLAEQKNITIKDAREYVKATFEIVSDELSVTNDVYLQSFGKFRVKARQVNKPGSTDKFMANIIGFKPFDALKAKA